MKRITLTRIRSTALLLWLALTAHSLDAKGIEFFHGSLEEAREVAAREDKLLFIDCYATWCGPCTWMSNSTFTDAEAGDFFNANFINVKIDGETDEGIEFRRKVQLRAYPTLVFMDAQGEIVRMETGARDVSGLLDLGRDVLGMAPEAREASPDPIQEQRYEVYTIDAYEMAQVLQDAIDRADTMAFLDRLDTVLMDTSLDAAHLLLDACYGWFTVHGQQDPYFYYVWEVAEANWDHAEFLFGAAYYVLLMEGEGELLDDAISWIDRSVELAPDAYNTELGALLHAKSGDREEALELASRHDRLVLEAGLERDSLYDSLRQEL